MATPNPQEGRGYLQPLEDTALVASPPVRLNPEYASAPSSRPRVDARTLQFREFSPMSIFNRARDILASNLTELLDRSDEPEKMIRVIIFEMNETLVEVRASAARTIADQKELRRHASRLNAMRDGWAEKAELAVSKGREDLARAALIERRKAATMADQITAEIAVLDDGIRGYEADIARLQTKLDEARSRQATIQARRESAHNRIRLREMTDGERVRDALARFDDLEREVDFAEGRADVLNMGRPMSLEDEIAALDDQDDISRELAAMRERQQARAASETGPEA